MWLIAIYGWRFSLAARTSAVTREISPARTRSDGFAARAEEAVGGERPAASKLNFRRAIEAKDFCG